MAQVSRGFVEIIPHDNFIVTLMTYNGNDSIGLVNIYMPYDNGNVGIVDEHSHIF